MDPRRVDGQHLGQGCLPNGMTLVQVVSMMLAPTRVSKPGKLA
jgi:hypothetical protein